VSLLEALAARLERGKDCAAKAKILRAYLAAHHDELRAFATWLNALPRPPDDSQPSSPTHPALMFLHEHELLERMFAGANACAKNRDFVRAWTESGSIFSIDHAPNG
jgi:hypothetical protein